MKIGLQELFRNIIDRIEIRLKNGKLLERCYNVRKLGSVGVCRTDQLGKNWGFCSRACKYGLFPLVKENEPYEEAEFKYLDESPEGSLFKGSNVVRN